MKKHIAKISMLTLCAAAILAVPASSSAQATTNTPAPPVKKRAAAPSVAVSFHGVLTAVDTNAMTLTIEKRTFNMTSETIVTKNDKPAVLAEGAVGDQVSGTYKKNADAKLDAVTVRFSNSTGGKAKKESSGN
jgi:Cu/Ag efflux protein CusF